jgi:hypothetical protein
MDRALDISAGVRRGPQPDDVSICIRCGQYLVYDQDVRLRVMRGEEFKQLDGWTRHQLARARAQIQRNEGIAPE